LGRLNPAGKNHDRQEADRSSHFPFSFKTGCPNWIIAFPACRCQGASAGTATMATWKSTTTERSLRGIAVGRRNWTFLGSDNGGRTAAILTSLTTTCKRLGVDPFEYLRELFQRISTHSQSNRDDLLADRWKAAQVTTA
jgi:hypothetical protein